MAAVPGGSPPVPFDQIRRHLPTLADDYVIALIKLATAVAAMGKLSGFRNAREPIYAPRVSSYTAAADGSSPDASIAQAHPRSMTRYALRERRRTTGFAALVPAEDSLPARTQATTSPYLTIFQRLYSLLYRFWHGPLRHGGDIDQGKMEDARVVISPSDSDDDDDGDWMPMDDTSASDSTDDEEEETSSMPVDRGELFEELYYLRRDQDEASDAVCSTSPIHHRQRPLSLTTTAHSSTPHQPPSLSLDTALCIICATDPRNIILQPCRCLVLCDGCREEMAARAYTLCPTCRSPVVGYSRVFAV